MIVKVILLASVLIGIGVIGIAIKMLFQKNATFEKTCGSVDPSTGKKIACNCNNNGVSECKNNP